MALLMVSCAGNLRIEKRHYRSGFHVDVLSRKNNVSALPVQNEQRNSYCQQLADTVPDSASVDIARRDVEKICPAVVLEHNPADVTEPDVTRESKLTPIPVPQPPVKKSKAGSPTHFNGPLEARSLNTMLLIAFGLLILGITCTVVAFAPFLYIIAPIAAAAPILILGAVVLSAIVMSKAKARRNQYAGTDPETSVFYDEMRIKALAILWISGVISVAFVIGIVAVLILLSGL